jgi:integrase
LTAGGRTRRRWCADTGRSLATGTGHLRASSADPDQLGHSSLNTTSIYLHKLSPSARIAKIKARRTEI